MIDRTMLGLDRLFDQQAVVERDHASSDSFGAKGAPDWQPVETVRAFMWWGTGTNISRMGGVHQRPEETVDLETGGMVLPEGTDVSARDRIAQVLDAGGAVLERGPFEILACAAFEGLVELTFRRVT
jgi:hypothetical protein